jgi:hypothetical protein
VLEDHICFALALIEALITQGQVVTFGAFAPHTVRLEVRGDSPQSLNELKRALALLETCPEHSIWELVSQMNSTPGTTCVILMLSPRGPKLPPASKHHLLLTGNEVRAFLSPVSSPDVSSSYA